MINKELELYGKCQKIIWEMRKLNSEKEEDRNKNRLLALQIFKMREKFEEENTKI